MGFLDKIKALGGKLRHEEPSETEKKPSITLRTDELDQWTIKMIAASGLDDKFRSFLALVEDEKTEAGENAKKFSDEEALQAIPERARTVTAVHGNAYTEEVEKLVQQIVFSDIFTFEDDQFGFHQALDEFRNQTGKNTAALKEFMKKEVETVEHALKKIEDATVRFLQQREDAQFADIERVHVAQEKLNKLDDQQEKYHELKTRLEQQLSAVEQKQQKLTDKINEQRKLIRNPAALQALDDLTKLEKELDEITRMHEHAASDALAYYKKHHELSIPSETHGVLQDLPKHPSSFVAEHPSEIMNAFALIADHLEQEGRGNLGNLIQRLKEQSQRAVQDANRAEEILPKQRKRKQEIMRDVAAINIYDQQQFLTRAVREQKELQAKIAFVEEQLHTTGKFELEREIKDAARSFGATIIGDSLDDVRPDADEQPLNEQPEEAPPDEARSDEDPDEQFDLNKEIQEASEEIEEDEETISEAAEVEEEAEELKKDNDKVQ